MASQLFVGAFVNIEPRVVALAAALGDPGTDPATAPHGVALVAAGFGADVEFAAMRARFDLVAACDDDGTHRIVRLAT